MTHEILSTIQPQRFVSSLTRKTCFSEIQRKKKKSLIDCDSVLCINSETWNRPTGGKYLFIVNVRRCGKVLRRRESTLSPPWTDAQSYPPSMNWWIVIAAFRFNMLMMDCVEAMQRHLHLRLTGGSGWTEQCRPQPFWPVFSLARALSRLRGGTRPYRSLCGMALDLACAPPLTLAHSGTRLPILNHYKASQANHSLPCRDLSFLSYMYYITATLRMSLSNCRPGAGF